MLLLTSTSDLVTITTGSAGTVLVHTSWVDNASGTITPGRTDTPSITTATTTTIVAAPAASTQRNVKKISVFNSSATVSNLITITHTDGTNPITLFSATLAPSESVEMADSGNFQYFDATGKPYQTTVSGGAGAFTTLTASSTVTLSPASANVTISPTGTGTVTISPASTVAISPTGALTINPTAASTLNNLSVGATTPSTGRFTFLGAGVASSTSSYVTAAAGTATVAPMVVTGGTNLTTAAAGAFENDAICPYFTTNTTDGRAIISAIQQFRLTANGTAISTVNNFFGTTSNISLVSGAYYEIDIEMYFTWTYSTGTGILTWNFTNSAAPTSMNIHGEWTPVGGINSTTGASNLCVDIVNSTSAAQTLTTGAMTTTNTQYARFRIFLHNGTGTSLKIQVTPITGSTVTPLAGSRWTSRRIPTGNTGTFAA